MFKDNLDFVASSLETWRPISEVFEGAVPVAWGLLPRQLSIRATLPHDARQGHIPRGGTQGMGEDDSAGPASPSRLLLAPLQGAVQRGELCPSNRCMANFQLRHIPTVGVHLRAPIGRRLRRVPLCMNAELRRRPSARRLLAALELGCNAATLQLQAGPNLGSTNVFNGGRRDPWWSVDELDSALSGKQPIHGGIRLSSLHLFPHLPRGEQHLGVGTKSAHADRWIRVRTAAEAREID